MPRGPQRALVFGELPPWARAAPPLAAREPCPSYPLDLRRLPEIRWPRFNFIKTNPDRPLGCFPHLRPCRRARPVSLADPRPLPALAHLSAVRACALGRQSNLGR
jgi:hypothetical protein